MKWLANRMPVHMVSGREELVDDMGVPILPLAPNMTTLNGWLFMIVRVPCEFGGGLRCRVVRCC